MSHQIVFLRNGIKLIHEAISSPVSHFGILLNVGTRDEPDRLEGLAHFVEHTIFKGTTKRSSYQVLNRMEDVGGDLNASTSKEETYFHSSFLSPDYPRAIELLSDIFFNANFPEIELEKEKDVVCEEIKYYKDSPAEQIFDDFEASVFARHPLGRSILGTRQSVLKMKRTDIMQFVSEHYTLKNMVLSSVGNVSTRQLLSWCNRYFGERALPDRGHERMPFQGYVPVNKYRKAHTHQAHLMIGCPACSFYHEQNKPFILLTNILGGQGMNSRLNMAIREKKGYAYSVEASYVPFSDSGIFSVYVGCDNENAEACIQLALKEIHRLKTKALGTVQLAHAKKQLIGQMTIANETKLNEMLDLGRGALFFEEVESMQESIRKIENITASQILEVANTTFQEDGFSMLRIMK
ncbi:MAG: insulinase family protein [Bacteroidales bacterium]|jgi:predicted Zn-dependent peptidase|nr:insulinase family protein [Bacteroidales bacterium]